MKQSSRDKIQGATHQVKGALKEKAGRMTNNPNLQDRGETERIAGKVQKKVGDIEKVFER